ncbi:MAG: helix-turn-helix domain-containing protein [Bacteroides sp.]|nr:helix-turn-helix domain-containing protein [Bacillota bacterium]MCM1393315.1 helix-turn-helix domain-containing protein [[Eubacterium] siraeum]MCM1455643.1 helix-turn-helix domain-containing protein [Bacteroides sp.]
MKFAERFNEVLKYSQLSQVQLAEKLNVNKATVTNYKKGKIAPSLETFFELCKLLDVSADYLLGLSDTF